jgi:hypothetical protein
MSLSASAAQCESGAVVAEVKYDNFYTPGNREFYDSFKYADLPKNEHRIRLLRIHPLVPGADDSTTIQCDLLDEISLEQYTEKFTTVSYCAGDPKKTEIVLINGLSFNAFANLGHTLRQARYFWKKTYGDRELLLWADQICIDQSNSLERSNQVSFMGDIYAAAEQVLACLSTEGSRSGGLEWLKKLTAYQNRLGNRSTEVNYFEHSWTIESLHRAWDVFIDTVLTSPWWSRAWVWVMCNISIYKNG